MRTAVPVFVVSVLAALATSCASHDHTACADCAKAQSVVESVAKQNPDVTRLTVHCAMGGQELKVCASTAASKRGSASDPEDKKAVETNQTVVLDEAGALDVTVPIHVKNGKPMAACGVTLKNVGMTRAQMEEKAKTIAKAVEAGIPNCCESCCK